MPRFKMISELPQSSLEGGIDLLNKYEWNIQVQHRDKEWLVFGGHKLLFAGDTKTEADSFLYGLSLGLSLLPPEAAQALEKFVQHCRE